MTTCPGITPQNTITQEEYDQVRRAVCRVFLSSPPRLRCCTRFAARERLAGRPAVCRCSLQRCRPQHRAPGRSTPAICRTCYSYKLSNVSSLLLCNACVWHPNEHAACMHMGAESRAQQPVCPRRSSHVLVLTDPHRRVTPAGFADPPLQHLQPLCGAHGSPLPVVSLGTLFRCCACSGDVPPRQSQVACHQDDSASFSVAGIRVAHSRFSIAFGCSS